ncbi:hypothetical protein ACW9HQ_36125 [Nocardia gipuzkoensis]
MPTIVRIPFTPLDQWTTIQVPAQAELVWVDSVYIVGPGKPGGEAKYKYSVWSVPDSVVADKVTCLIRAGSFPRDSNGQFTDIADAGLADAKAFYCDARFFWYLKDPFGTIGGMYPPNPGRTV